MLASGSEEGVPEDGMRFRCGCEDGAGGLDGRDVREGGGREAPEEARGGRGGEGGGRGSSPTALTARGRTSTSPRGRGWSRSSGSGRERLRAEEWGEPCEEAGCHRAAEVQAGGVARDPRVRVQMEGRGGLLGDSAIKGIFGEYVAAGKFADMAKEMIMKAFIYNIFIVQIRGLPREADRGRDRWAARRGVVQHSISQMSFKSTL